MMQRNDRMEQTAQARPMDITPDESGRLVWGNGLISLVFQTSPDAAVTLVALSGTGMPRADSATWAQRDPRPIVEVLSSRDGSTDNRLKLLSTSTGALLRFAQARSWRDAACVRHLEITQREPVSGLSATSVFEAHEGVSAVRTYTRLSCPTRYPIEGVSSVSVTLPMEANSAAVESTRIYYGDSAWAVENDWHSAMLRDTVVRDRNFEGQSEESSSRFARRSSSMWSTGEHEPAGVLEVTPYEHRDVAVPPDDDSSESRPATDPRWQALSPTERREQRGIAQAQAAGSTPSPFSVMWQIENNGAWEWEVGENDPGLHVTAFGPEYEDHHWFTSLGEGNDFVSVPASLAIAAGDWQQAVAQMTLQRRALRIQKAEELGRRPMIERMNSLVVYNDYMNTLWGDPRLDKELALIEGASKLDVDVFCIDAGWYDSTDGGWWNMVGEWEPSTNRFGDRGLSGVAQAVREHGMGLGLWLEPEVIGTRSPMASKLPDEAFICRHGERVADSDRYLLDFRSPEARRHVDQTVDRLIRDFGAVFFKFDYNSVPGVGTDVDAESVGGGLLSHARAYLDWLDDLRRRHPDVMIENCGSGAMRADYAQLSRLDLQSTSDQCDPLIYAAIAASAGMTILPEQQGNWGYAQQEMSDETASLTLAAGVLGRLYLSGFINRMDQARLGLVNDAVALHRRILARQGDLAPWWPAGLPDFEGDWLVSGLRSIHESAGSGYVTIWRRRGRESLDIPFESNADGSSALRVEQVFPDPSQPEHAPHAAQWRVEDRGSGLIRFTAGQTDTPSARIYRISIDR
jgi:alpha-galactosidase